MRVRAVIGAGLGDEGKGRAVDHFVKDGFASQTLVVRYNGGAQAGHTVVLPDGKRHSFHHFGSGALKGAPTYLSKFFIANPVYFAKELKVLKALGANVDVYCSPFCYVTTPWDMMINELLEMKRGNDRHGSCGFGINETVERSGSALLNVQMLRSDHLNETLDYIMNEWVPRRCEQLDLEPDGQWKGWLNSRTVLARFKKDIESFNKNVIASDPVFKTFEEVIFEGAQGLMLDQNHANFPHVTRSNTGSKNVREIIEDFGLHDELEVTYVTRSYATRHGAGPLMHEMPEMAHDDLTNVDNRFQGKLRFGILDVNQLCLEIGRDMDYLAGIEFNPSIMVTCLDQHAGACYIDNQMNYLTYEGLCKHALADQLNFNTAYGSFGERSDSEVKAWVREGVAV